MGLNVKELVLSIPVLVFILWVFAAPIPQQRIERVCQPINWVGNIATSSTALATDGHTQTAVRWSDKLSYSCQYMVWRLFYQDAYNKAVAEGRVLPAAAVTPQGTEQKITEPQKAEGAAVVVEQAPASAPATAPTEKPAAPAPAAIPEKDPK